MIALCDQRAFYASCESVFRPDLRDKAVAVLSNNDGCVVALNTEAKALGVQKFTPYFQQRHLTMRAGVHVFSSNYALYGEISRRIMTTLREKAPRIEEYSIDECFCDLGGVPIDRLKDFGFDLKNTIWRQQRISMGVSIGTTKTLAKLGQFATKMLPSLNGVCLLENETQIRWLARRTPIEEVWGVGRQLAKTLRASQIENADQLRRLPIGLARKWGHKPLERTVRELNGEPCIPIEATLSDKESIVCSRSFGEKLYEKHELAQAVSEFAARGAEKLRKQHGLCGAIRVSLRTSHHTDAPFSASQSARLATPTENSCTLIAQAKVLLDKIYQPGFAYAKAGIELSELQSTHHRQYDLWQANAHRTPALMHTLDQINQRYGRGTIQSCAQGFLKRHAMHQNMLSPGYLTHWSDIPRIRC